MDIVEVEDNLSSACSENTDSILEISLQPNWHNEVNQKVSDIDSGGRFLVNLYVFLTKLTSPSF